MILESPKIKSLTVSIVSPSTGHELMGPDGMILVFLKLSFNPAFYFLLSPSSSPRAPGEPRPHARFQESLWELASAARSRGSPGEYQADEQAGVALPTWRVSGR